jgi:type III pantothenate kinase
VPTDDPAAWQAQLDGWGVQGPTEWAVAGVHPPRRDRLVAWLRERGVSVRVVSDYRELPIRVAVDAPDRVGIDRLLNGVAAVARVPPGVAAIVIDAGSAVTVDLIDGEAAFHGGAIFPGLRLMASALNTNTALLPLVEDFGVSEIPGRDTAAAIRAGVYHAVCGGIDRLVGLMAATNLGAKVFLAGGNIELAAGLRCDPHVIGPALTLDGLRRTAWPGS